MRVTVEPSTPMGRPRYHGQRSHVVFKTDDKVGKRAICGRLLKGRLMVVGGDPTCQKCWVTGARWDKEAGH